MSKQENINNGEIEVRIPLVTTDATPASQLSWVVRGFLCNVCSYHMKGSTKRVSAMSVAIRMANSALEAGSISNDEHVSITQEISNIEEQIYPGCSLI